LLARSIRKERQLASTRQQDIKRFVQAALNVLDLDYSVFDILRVDGQTDSWKLALLDRGPVNGQRIFQIAVIGGPAGSDEIVKEQIVSQLANRLAGLPPGVS